MCFRGAHWESARQLLCIETYQEYLFALHFMHRIICCWALKWILGTLVLWRFKLQWDEGRKSRGNFAFYLGSTLSEKKRRLEWPQSYLSQAGLFRFSAYKRKLLKFLPVDKMPPKVGADETLRRLNRPKLQDTSNRFSGWLTYTLCQPITPPITK